MSMRELGEPWNEWAGESVLERVGGRSVLE